MIIGPSLIDRSAKHLIYLCEYQVAGRAIGLRSRTDETAVWNNIWSVTSKTTTLIAMVIYYRYLHNAYMQSRIPYKSSTVHWINVIVKMYSCIDTKSTLICIIVLHA
jgi:hypothetical protein